MLQNAELVEARRPDVAAWLNFVFSLLHSLMTVLIVRRLLQLEYSWNWIHELITALVTAILAVIIFAALDRTKRRE